jgi:DnaJ-class molecular chaperone
MPTFKDILSAAEARYPGPECNPKTQQTTVCPKCSGTGRQSNQNKGPKDCRHCGGSGLVKGSRA